MARSLRAAGVRPGDKAHIAFGYGLFTGGLGWHYGAEGLGATVIPASGGNTERQVQLIRDFAPDALLATPSYMLVIADEFERQGFDPGESGLRIGIFGAEPCSEAVRAEIESRFRFQAYDSYGLSEVIGPGVAQELPESKGMLTLWEDHFWPEIIDPATGAVLPEGETGELVLTTLSKEGMPVIRYRTRDLTRILPLKRAPRRMERIKGRSDDMLIIRGVNLFPSQIEEILAKEERLAPHYLLEVRRPERLDELTIVVEERPRGGALVAGDREQLARKAEQWVKAYVGVTAIVRVVAPGSIKRSEGKAKRVLDLRPKD
jgi:phenylacetate-CoA ligase